jgi:hypothetical protein
MKSKLLNKNISLRLSVSLYEKLLKECIREKISFSKLLRMKLQIPLSASK